MARATLPDRAVLAITGLDRVPFLQGLVSNDVAQAAPGRAVWAALLTPQGKWLADFFVHALDDRLLLDVEAAQVAMLAARLLRFRLRSRIEAAPAPELTVQVGWDEAIPLDDRAAPDPRLPEAGWRALLPSPPPPDATPADWDLHRLRLGLPDGSRDLIAETSILLEVGFDELHGVSWTKGCYLGQELTARTKYRGLVKRRLVPVHVDGPLPPPGTPVQDGTGRDVGDLRSGRADRALASLRIDALGNTTLRCAEARLRPTIPPWMRLPARDAA